MRGPGHLKGFEAWQWYDTNLILVPEIKKGNMDQ